jgi:hypothetical protein
LGAREQSGREQNAPRDPSNHLEHSPLPPSPAAPSSSPLLPSTPSPTPYSLLSSPSLTPLLSSLQGDNWEAPTAEENKEINTLSADTKIKAPAVRPQEVMTEEELR